MEKLPASVGWVWVKEGFGLFRKQPAEMSTLFLSYLFLMLAVGIIPLFGQVLPLMLLPVFAMTFMQACMNIEQDKKVYPNLLITPFRSSAIARLLQLGVLYLVAAVLAIAASSLVDGGVFWQVMSGRADLDEQAIRESNMSLGMMFAAAIYLPAAMAFWYAAPLISWQNMGVGKAIFYSFFAVKRQGKAFLVYAISWLFVGVLLPSIISSLIGLLFGKQSIAMIFLLPLSLIMTVVMYCSFYPTYTHVFGKPEPAVPQPNRLEQ